MCNGSEKEFLKRSTNWQQEHGKNAQNHSLRVKELKIKAIRRCHLMPVKGCYWGEYARDSVSKNKEMKGGGGKKKLKRKQAHKQTN